MIGFKTSGRISHGTGVNLCQRIRAALTLLASSSYSNSITPFSADLTDECSPSCSVVLFSRQDPPLPSSSASEGPDRPGAAKIPTTTCAQVDSTDEEDEEDKGLEEVFFTWSQVGPVPCNPQLRAHFLCFCPSHLLSHPALLCCLHTGIRGYPSKSKNWKRQPASRSDSQQIAA